LEYNEKNGITPKTIIKKIQDITDQLQTEHDKAVNELVRLDEKMLSEDPKKLIKMKEEEMSEAVKVLDFETAAILRDEIAILKQRMV
jgi:excinuclease ABC subunit B